MFSIHDAKVQHLKSLNSRNVMNRHELASYCELFIRVNPCLKYSVDDLQRSTSRCATSQIFSCIV